MRPAQRLRSCARELHGLAGTWGVPGALEYSSDLLAGSTTEHVAYDVAVGLGLALGDLADAVEAAADAVGGIDLVDAAGDDDSPLDDSPVDDSALDDPAGPGAPASGGGAGVVTDESGAAADGSRARQAGRKAYEVAAAALVRALVHPWMTAGPEAAGRAAARLDDLVGQFTVGLARLRGVLSDLLGAPRTPVVDVLAAEAPWPPGPIAELHAALRQARLAFAGLEAAMAGHGPEVDRLRHRGPLHAPALRRHTDALATADAACRSALFEIRVRTPATAGLATGGWLAAVATGLLPDGTLLPALAARGLVDTDAETQALAELGPIGGSHGETALQPSASADSAAVRRALSGVPTARLGGLLARHPHLLPVLAAPAEDGVPDLLADVLAETPEPAADCAAEPAGGPGEGAAEVALAATDPVPLRRIEAIRQACARAGEEPVRRAALLYPRLLGGLDGAPLWARMLANRALVRVELDAARARDVAFEGIAAQRREAERRSPARRATGQVLDAWLAREEAAGFLLPPHDRPRYLRMQLRASMTLYQSFLHDLVDQGRGAPTFRQVLLFDGAGGRIAEVCGRLDERTRHVAVYVGGTGTTVPAFGWPVGICRGIVADDPAGETAAVAWMGAEFPAAIGSHAPFSRYARAAGRPLRDHVAGLSIPADVSVTLVGHSYGGAIIGAAELLGVRADRVVYAGCPGAGPGVRTGGDLPATDPLGRAREVRRYVLTAPGDLIRLWQRSDEPWTRLRTSRGRAVGDWFVDRTLGADPSRLPGALVLDTGLWEIDRDDRRAGDVLFGPRGHADVVEPGTTSFRRITAIVRGEDPAAIAPPPHLTPRRPGRRDAPKNPVS